MEQYIIHHIPEENLFETEVDHVIGYVEYEIDGDVLDIMHTIVPDEIGGRGVASALVGAAYKYAKENGMKVRPTCAYVRVWVKRHPEMLEYTCN